MASTPSHTPVTVLTGYLGSGKTTLLNRILNEAHGRRYAVIVNEFGEIGIDNDLVVNADEEIFEMNNGCVCCTVRGDLIRVLHGLMRRRRRFDGILLETTGLADPAPVAQTFFVDEKVRRRMKLDAIVAVTDAKHLLQDIDHAHEAQEQLAFADVILLNKTDLVSEKELTQVRARIASINPYATLYPTERCSVGLEKILGKDAFNLDRILELEPNFLEETHEHGHDRQLRSVSLVAEQPLSPHRLIPWIEFVVRHFGPDILRMKGIVAMKDDDQRFVIQGVHMLVEGAHQRRWGAHEKRESRLVFIGRNLPQLVLQEGFQSCYA